ncbi:MAG: cobalamin-dependent protein, partial [bacterium]
MLRETTGEPVDFLFVNPPLTLRERYGGLAIGGSNLPPLGLANLAAAVREAGRRPAVLDAAIHGLDVARTVKKIIEIAPRVVGFTGATVAVDNLVAAARGVRSALPSVPIVVGGAHVSAVPRETLERYHDCIDAAVVGEGDVTAVELLNALLD